MGLRSLEICLFLQCGDRLKTSESDVDRRQILTSKVDPRARVYCLGASPMQNLKTAP